MPNKIILSLLLLLLPGWAAAEEAGLPLPPESLAQWYKPLNKRQVWLHNMFKLRREMQAVAEYAQLRDRPLLKKWSGRLVAHYRRIAEMVPEWRDELELAQADALEAAAARGDFSAVAQAQRRLGHSCKSCHREYRAVTALLYRAADFSSIRIAADGAQPAVGFDRLMQSLSHEVNRIKIASEDGRDATASQALARLTRGLRRLGASCDGCHQGPEPRERILGREARGQLTRLGAAIEAGDRQATGRRLGAVAVTVCARCHGVHRTAGDLRRRLLRNRP